MEAADPCEADAYAYSIQGVAVTDFITPHFYDPVATPATRYSFTGAVKAPRQILPGGYISWVNPETNEWQQLRYIDPHSPPTIVDLGPAKGASLRVWIDGLTYPITKKYHKSNVELLAHAKTRRTHLAAAATVRAKYYAGSL